MPLAYRLNILDELKKRGYTTYRIRREKLFSEGTIQAFRDQKPVSWAAIATLCRLLDCQPGDLLEYVPDADVE